MLIYFDNLKEFYIYLGELSLLVLKSFLLKSILSFSIESNIEFSLKSTKSSMLISE